MGMGLFILGFSAGGIFVLALQYLVSRVASGVHSYSPLSVEGRSVAEWFKEYPTCLLCTAFSHSINEFHPTAGGVLYYALCGYHWQEFTQSDRKLLARIEAALQEREASMVETQGASTKAHESNAPNRETHA